MDAAPKPNLGVIAGGGAAPMQIVQACREEGRPFFLFCLEGQADPALAKEGEHAWLSLGEAGKLREICEKKNIEEIVMIGRVRRPSITELKPDFLGVKLLAKIGLSSLGDDGVLRSVAAVLEKACNVKVRGAHEIVSNLLSPEGVLTQNAPDEKAAADIAKGFDIVETLGRLDVGQAVIVQQGLVLGLEAVEGTDALIARAGSFRRKGGGGVLVKAAKPQQDERLDLPSVGPETIRALREAGLAGVAVEADRSLMIEREKMIAEADAAGLFVVGVRRAHG